MKKRWRIKSAAAVFCLFMLGAVPVLAGDINDAEQTIINYYNQTFVYEGKTYAASEEAKAAVYQKLAADGTDLTESQAQAAIRQASKNIKKGIADGYLVEVTSGDEAENTETGQNTENVKNAENTLGTEYAPDTENAPDTGNTESVSKGKGKEIPENGDFTDPAGKPGEDAGWKADSGPEQEKADTSDIKTKDGMEYEPVWVDVQKLLEDAFGQGEKYAEVQMGEASSVTVEQYLEGKLTAVSGDGALLFEGELPLKNTGYHTGSFWITVLGIGVLFTSVLLAGFLCIRNKETGK